MNQPSIVIDTDEKLALVCRLLFYQPTGIIPTLENYGKILKWRDINTPQASYGKIQKPNCVHQCNLLFLTHDKYKGKTWKAVLQIIDVASRFKASISLILKKSSEVAKAFRKIYDNPNNPLTYPTLLQYNNGKEWAGQTSQLMKEHGV
ncbi:11658_t:CDS:2, partial [Racocetra persica]